MLHTSVKPIDLYITMGKQIEPVHKLWLLDAVGINAKDVIWRPRGETSFLEYFKV